MNRQILQSFVLLIVFLAFVGAGYGKSDNHAKANVYKFDQELEGEVGGKLLSPGTYKINVTFEPGDECKITIAKNKQTLLEQPCKIEKINDKVASNGVAYGRNSEGKRVIRWLVLGDRQVKVFFEPTATEGALAKEGSSQK